MPPLTKPLTNLRILVTRPAERAHALIKSLMQAGAEAIPYPVITIENSPNPEQLKQQLRHLDQYDLAIFISPTAVTETLQRIKQLPPGLKVASIGSATSQLLEEQGIPVEISPDGHNSESLLKHSALAPETIHGKHILIFCGQGGRELLADTLTERGAIVTYAEVYRRQKNTALASLSREQLDELDVVLITSNEGLQNLYDIIEDTSALIRLPVIVPGERAYQLAQKLGFHSTIISDNATDAASLQALYQWSQTYR